MSVLCERADESLWIPKLILSCYWTGETLPSMLGLVAIRTKYGCTIWSRWISPWSIRESGEKSEEFMLEARMEAVALCSAACMSKIRERSDQISSTRRAWDSHVLRIPSMHSHPDSPVCENRHQEAMEKLRRPSDPVRLSAMLRRAEQLRPIKAP